MKLKLNNTTKTGQDNNPQIFSTPKKRYPIVLSIAGSDSSGGAGIQADLKTCSALGVYGATVITAITAQNTQGVQAQLHIPVNMVHSQLLSVMNDISPSVIKIGMLGNAEIVEVLAQTLKNYSTPIILDPAMIASSGHRLMADEAQNVLIKQLLPITTLLTPNIPEMQALCNLPLTTLEEKNAAAQHLLQSGLKAILLKGGHEHGDMKTDILYRTTDKAISITHYTSPTIFTHNIHGTGCTLSAAIAAFMARGFTMEEAVSKAKIYITEAIKNGADISIGHGCGPVNHLFNPIKIQTYEE